MCLYVHACGGAVGGCMCGYMWEVTCGVHCMGVCGCTCMRVDVCGYTCMCLHVLPLLVFSSKLMYVLLGDLNTVSTKSKATSAGE